MFLEARGGEDMAPKPEPPLIAAVEDKKAVGGRHKQVSVATEGGLGTPVPDISIEVDDLDEVERRVREARLVIEYGPTNEPWGVRRFSEILQLRLESAALRDFS